MLAMARPLLMAQGIRILNGEGFDPENFYRRRIEIGRDYFFDSPRVPRCAVAAKIPTGYGARSNVSRGTVLEASSRELLFGRGSRLSALAFPLPFLAIGPGR
jgi:hypothetical protein